MGMSQQTSAVVLNILIRDAANPYTYLTAPETLELALFVSASSGAGADPGASADVPDGNNSVTGEVSSTSTGYDRTAVEFGDAATSGNPASIDNSAAVNFPTATANWAASTNYVSGWALYDVNATVNARVAVWTGAFNVGKNVLQNDTVTVAAGNLVLRLT